MYYKLYRRRYTIYALVTILFIFILLNNNLNSIDQTSNSKSRRDSNSFNINVKRSNNVRINMQNYILPKPCNDCPGENGKAVYLNV